MRLKRCIPNVLIVTSFAIRMEYEWYGVYHSFRGVLNGCRRTKFFLYDGDATSEWY